MKWIHAIGIALLFLSVPEDAWAWGPATHLHFGVAILNQLNQVTDGVRALLAYHPLPFLYGCVSADVVLAKKWGRSLMHCHHWHNGLRLIEEAETPRIRAFSFGYVSHLAADTISHNCFVPSRTVLSYDSGMFKHVYWEQLFDRRLTTQKTLNLFHSIARGDFSDCDDYFESKIPVRIFDFNTNKRIFNQLLLLQSLHSWQKIWGGLSRKSPWPLEEGEVHEYTQRSLTAILSFLNEYRDSEYVSLDPIGQTRLRSSHEIRRNFRKKMGQKSPPSTDHVRSVVERFSRDPFSLISTSELKL